MKAESGGNDKGFLYHISEINGDMGHVHQLDLLVENDKDVRLSLVDPDQIDHPVIEFCSGVDNGQNVDITTHLRGLAMYLVARSERDQTAALITSKALDQEVEIIQANPSLTNNFTSYLPFGAIRSQYSSKILNNANHIYHRYDDRYSLMLDFFSDIDQVIEDLEIPIESFQILQNDTENVGDISHRALVFLALPVYRRLRELGYTHDKLTK